MRKAEFRINAKRDCFRGNDCLVVFSAEAYRFEHEQTCDPERENLSFFFTREEAAQHASEIDVPVGFIRLIRTFYVPYVDFNHSVEFGQELSIEKFASMFEDYDEEFVGDTNEGDSVNGCVIIEWSWEKYPGYCRNFKGMRVGQYGETENSIYSGNEERTFRSNETVLVAEKELEGLSKDDIFETISREISCSSWKWNSFKAGPASFDLSDFVKNNF